MCHLAQLLAKMLVLLTKYISKKKLRFNTRHNITKPQDYIQHIYIIVPGYPYIISLFLLFKHNTDRDRKRGGGL